MRTIRLPKPPAQYDAGEQGEMRRQLERAVLDLSNPPPGTIDGSAIIPGTLPSKSFLRLYRVTDWTPIVGNAIQWDAQDYGTDDGRPAETDTVFLTSMGEGTWLFLAQISIKDAPSAGLVTLEMRRGTEVLARAKWNPNVSTVQVATLQAVVANPAAGDRIGVYYVGGPTDAGFVKGGGASKGLSYFLTVRL